MKWLLQLAARLYPAEWWDRYGVEFQALLDETTPEWRAVGDVLSAGVQMYFKGGRRVLTVMAFSIVGALVAGTIAFRTANRFASTGTLSVQRVDQAIGSVAARPEDVMPRLARDAFRPEILTGIIEKHDLYHGERARLSAEDIVSLMRDDIRIQLISRSVFQVSFASSDGRKAQDVARDLVGQLAQSKDEPSGSTVRLIDSPDEAQASVSPRRVALAGVGGFGGGGLLGILFGLRRRHAQSA